jgi:ABC-type transport system substrate-binding protein
MFHDVEPMNGRIVTAEDLAYTYQRFPAAIENGSTINPVLYNWMDMAGIAASDEVTVTIPQTKPFAELMQMMAQHHFAVIAQEADQAAGGDLSTTNSAGCGPYILTEADPSTKMVWTRNPNYFSHDHSDPFYFPANGGYPDAYEQYVIPDPSTTQAQLISGDLDQLYFNILNVDRVLAEEFRNQGLQVFEGQANTNCTLVMAAPNFPDTRVRQALQKAIDYQGFIDSVYLGDGELGAPVGNGYPDSVRLPREEIAEYLSYNPDEAVALWEAAASEKTNFVMLGIANFPFMEAATGFVKQSIESVLPVSIEIQAIDIPSWIARAVAAEKDWDFLVQFSQSTPDVPTFNILGTFDAGGQAAVGSNYKVDSPVPEIAELATESARLSALHYAENDPEARTALLHDFQRFALENAVPAIPLPVRKIDWLVASARVKNVQVDNPNFFRSMLLDNMYLDPPNP